jgi:hypothetical protein
MRVSEFPIGRGEVYVSKYKPREVLEVVGVQPAHGGRWILIGIHGEDGRRVDGSERIVFGATSFLRRYRPATPADFPTPRQRLRETLERNSAEWNALPEWVRKSIDTRDVFDPAPAEQPATRPRRPGGCFVCDGETVATPDGTACFNGCAGAAGPGWQ